MNIRIKIRHIRISLGSNLNNFDFLDEICPKRVPAFMSKAGQMNQIQYIWICVDKNFHLKRTIFIFGKVKNWISLLGSIELV